MTTNAALILSALIFFSVLILPGIILGIKKKNELALLLFGMSTFCLIYFVYSQIMR